MKKYLAFTAIALTCVSTLVLAEHHEKNTPSPKSEHELSVGNPKAAESGNVADDKSVKEEKMHKDSRDKAKHDKHDGNAKGHDKKSY
ncbi:MAG TPA: hypothetical protein VGD04_00260 [Methylophilus sp.]